MKTRHWILLGTAAAAALAFSTLVGRGGRRSTRAEGRSTTEMAPIPAPPRMAPSAAEPARDVPRFDDVVAGFPARDERRDHRDAPVVDGVVQIGPRQIRAGAVPPQPPAPAAAKSNAAWATSYAVAMCECHTRACAADLQGRFIHEMGAAEYDEARDGEATREALHRAVSCYVALPEDS